MSEKDETSGAYAYMAGDMNTAKGSGMMDGTAKRDDSDSDDPEVQAELKYAKEHGVDPHSIPMRQRLKLLRKAKSAEEASRQVNGVVQVPRSQKNQRKSRAVKRKGGISAKKGSGGKWTWGTASKLYEEPEFADPNDPNYDSDAQGQVRFEAIIPETDEGQYEHYVETILLEYFENGDGKAAVESIDELTLSKRARCGVIRLAVTLSMNRKPSTRELTSQLLSELHLAEVLDDDDAARGFFLLLNTDLPDLAIDYVDATDIVGNFVARAVADEALPHAFLETDKDKLASNDFAKEALVKAEVMLLEKHRLDTIWCPGGGTRPVRFLVTKIDQLLEEYLTNGDVNEATRCIVDLEVPHFHHEVVFQAGMRVIESLHERTARALASLLRHLHTSDLLTGEQVKIGFERLYNEMPDLSIDVPRAYALLESWVAVSTGEGFLPDGVARKMPQKGRKRVVSEGDTADRALKVIDVPHPLI